MGSLDTLINIYTFCVSTQRVFTIAALINIRWNDLPVDENAVKVNLSKKKLGLNFVEFIVPTGDSLHLLIHKLAALYGCLVPNPTILRGWHLLYDMQVSFKIVRRYCVRLRRTLAQNEFTFCSWGVWWLLRSYDEKLECLRKLDSKFSNNSGDNFLFQFELCVSARNCFC